MNLDLDSLIFTGKLEYLLFSIESTIKTLAKFSPEKGNTALEQYLVYQRQFDERVIKLYSDIIEGWNDVS